jgi:hypothetical protein
LADYAKLALALTYSENSDYSSPKLKTSLDNWTSTTATHYEVQYREIGTSSETIELGGFTTIECLVLKNKDSTNYVTATFDSAGNSSVDNILRVGAGKILVLTDVTPGSDLLLQANTAACDVEIIIVGT